MLPARALGPSCGGTQSSSAGEGWGSGLLWTAPGVGRLSQELLGEPGLGAAGRPARVWGCAGGAFQQEGGALSGGGGAVHGLGLKGQDRGLASLNRGMPGPPYPVCCCLHGLGIAPSTMGLVIFQRLEFASHNNTFT